MGGRGGGGGGEVYRRREEGSGILKAAGNREKQEVQLGSSDSPPPHTHCNKSLSNKLSLGKGSSWLYTHINTDILISSLLKAIFSHTVSGLHEQLFTEQKTKQKRATVSENAMYKGAVTCHEVSM